MEMIALLIEFVDRDFSDGDCGGLIQHGKQAWDSGLLTFSSG